MPTIWEMIMCYLDATDVANALRTNKALRSAMGQGLRLNGKLRRHMDISATTSAISRRRYQSRLNVKLKLRGHLHAPDYLHGFEEMQAIDGAWYWYSMEERTRHVFLLREGSEKGQVGFQAPLFSRESRYGLETGESFLTVNPTMDAKRVMVRDAWNYHSKLINLGDASATTVSTNPCWLHRENDELWTLIESCQKTCLAPMCARYRLYEERNEGNIVIYMTLLTSKGEPDSTIKLHTFKPEQFALTLSTILHCASNEQVRRTFTLGTIKT